MYVELSLLPLQPPHPIQLLVKFLRIQSRTLYKGVVPLQQHLSEEPSRSNAAADKSRLHTFSDFVTPNAAADTSRLHTFPHLVTPDAPAGTSRLHTIPDTVTPDASAGDPQLHTFPIM